MATPISRDELVAELADIGNGVVLIDAQGPGLFEQRHIPGAIAGSVNNHAEVLAAIGTDFGRPIVAYCTDAACTGSGIAVSLLESLGYRNVRQFVGGVAEWNDAGLPIASTATPTTIR
jgi:rhodanese-related sulfurtransferase